MFCSTIIPTINRPTLTRAVQSVLEQEFSADESEIIVVNDSGHQLPPADWQSSSRVRVVETNRRERCVARNTGAAIARGQYLHFLDDDDWLMPGALKVFCGLAQSSQSQWLYGGYEVVDNQGKVLERFQPYIGGNIFTLLVCGESIPLQASLIEAELFFRSGGFDPTIAGVEDRDLERRIGLTCSVNGNSTIVARIRIGPVGSTTDWTMIAENDRRGREKALLAAGAANRIRASDESSYWRGRLSRAFLGSTVWNFRRHNYSVATSRAIASLTFAGPHLLTNEFWRGLRTGLRDAHPVPTMGKSEENASLQA